MAEAIISRATGTAGSSELSAETKELLGLPEDADINDAFQSLAYKDDEYATVMIEVYNPDGTPAPDARIRMADSGGTNVTYSVNSDGKCIFKTKEASATFYNDEEYIDINSSNQTVDTVIGTVKSVIFNRSIYDNSYTVNITSNQNIKFSNYLNTLDAMCVGGSGGSGSGYYKADYLLPLSGGAINLNASATNYNSRWIPCDYYSGNGYYNKQTVSITGNTNYQCIIGAGGIGGRSSASGQAWIGDDAQAASGWGIRCSAPRVTGNTGGTTSFGGIISAAGGGGSNENVTGAGGNINYTSRVKGGTKKASVTYTNAYHGRIYAYANGYDGYSGFVLLSNFVYK